MTLENWSTVKVNTDRSAAVNQAVFWLDVREYPPPLGVQLLLINAAAKRATLGQYVTGDAFWTHWQGLPKFKEGAPPCTPS